MKRRKHFAGEDRVLRFAVLMMAALLITGTAIVGLRMNNLRVDSSQGEEKLRELGEKDAGEIDARIRALEEEEERILEERRNQTIEERFAGCLILGDAVCQGFSEYGYLDAGLLSTGQNLCVTSADVTGLTDMILQAVSDEPLKLFLVLGMGDIETGNEEREAFLGGYEEILNRLKEGLPDCGIYVNSILPASQAAVAENESYARIPEYNEELSRLCEDMQVSFIDNSRLVKEEHYEEDGVHMTAAFYSEWLSYMAEQSEL
ncbi:MAG: SGNH/GDSL hydrolase family protein [Lachnospiraceae bacterium]